MKTLHLFRPMPFALSARPLLRLDFRRLRLIVILLSLAASSTSVLAQASPLDQLTEFVSASFQNRNLRGAAVISIRGTAIQFIGVGKTTDGQEVSAKTPFYIGSMSKAFTAAAILQMAERGRLELDAPVQRFLPEFHIADPRGSDITIRHLLNHTSGMTVTTYREWSMPQPGTLKEAVARLANVHLAMNPGMQFSYHNSNYTVLARLVEVISGQDFATYLKTNIFQPLGMLDTKTVDFVNERRDHVPSGHIYAFGHMFPMAAPRFFVDGAGGVVTTPNDYAIWLITQMKKGIGPNGVRVLLEKSIEMGQTPSPASAGYGFGWNRAPSGRISHSGGLPTYGAYAAMQGDKAAAVFVPVTSVMSPSLEIAMGVLNHPQSGWMTAIEPSRLKWWDFGLAVATLMIWGLCARASLRSRMWAEKAARKSVGRRALSFLPHIAVISAILFGIPLLVSQVVSWSWIWLWCYVPVWVTFLASCAAASAVVSGMRFVRLVSRPD